MHKHIYPHTYTYVYACVHTQAHMHLHAHTQIFTYTIETVAELTVVTQVFQLVDVKRTLPCYARAYVTVAWMWLFPGFTVALLTFSFREKSDEVMTKDPEIDLPTSRLALRDFRLMSVFCVLCWHVKMPPKVHVQPFTSHSFPAVLQSWFLRTLLH